MSHVTDEELLAYADERLPSESCTVIEQKLRLNPTLSERLTNLLLNRDKGDHSIGEIWRQHRLSCPPRAALAAYADKRLGDRLSRYLQFHLETIGCRVCAANLDDLERPDRSATAETRTRKIFQSSVGKLRLDDIE